MKKNTKTEKKKDTLLIVLLIILVVVAIVLVIVKLAGGKTIDSDSKIVNELHNYFSTDDLNNCTGLFNYTDDLANYDNISPESRMCLAYQKANIKESDMETETIKGDKKSGTCKLDDMTFKTAEKENSCTITKIKKDEIDATYEKLFNHKVEENSSFKIDGFNICYKKDNEYYCGLSESVTYTVGNDQLIYRVIKRAAEKGSKIVIYDYYIRLIGEKCYTTATTSTINEECSDAYSKLKDKEINYEFLQKYGTPYKHIYKQNKNGDYYWVSSKMIG